MINPPLFIPLQGTENIPQSKEVTRHKKHRMIDMIEDHLKEDLQIEMAMIEFLILMTMVEDLQIEMIMIKDLLTEVIMIDDLQRRVVMIEDPLKNNLLTEENMTGDPQSTIMIESHQKECQPLPSPQIVMTEDLQLLDHLTAMIGNQHPKDLLKEETQEDSQVNASQQVPHSIQILVVEEVVIAVNIAGIEI